MLTNSWPVSNKGPQGVKEGLLLDSKSRPLLCRHNIPRNIWFCRSPQHVGKSCGRLTCFECYLGQSFLGLNFQHIWRFVLTPWLNIFVTDCPLPRRLHENVLTWPDKNRLSLVYAFSMGSWRQSARSRFVGFRHEPSRRPRLKNMFHTTIKISFVRCTSSLLSSFPLHMIFLTCRVSHPSSYEVSTIRCQAHQPIGSERRPRTQRGSRLNTRPKRVVLVAWRS